MAKTRVEAEPRNDAYTGLLGISLAAMVGACVLLYMDYSTYDERTPPPLAKIDVPNAKLEKAPPSTGRPVAPKKDETEEGKTEPMPEPKKEPEMTRRPAPMPAPEHVAAPPAIELPPLPPPVVPVAPAPVAGPKPAENSDLVIPPAPTAPAPAPRGNDGPPIAIPKFDPSM